ncbi:hypothetical protein [Escherichia coli ISC7]|uniref:Uncharacterized protein n=1 Tax=Escherichia coli ISC7 TaxID=1432555 RepID=W1ERI2_ECOLX|nr:hypothetical protein [Escherichia coli ISC7]
MRHISHRFIDGERRAFSSLRNATCAISRNITSNGCWSFSQATCIWQASWQGKSALMCDVPTADA